MTASTFGDLGRRLGAGRLPREFVGYALVSAAALAVDWGVLIACTEFARLHYAVSAAIGFAAGLAVAYGLSVALVFRDRAITDRGFEFAVFALVGICGLGLTQALLHAFVDAAGLHYAQAKAPTAMLVFLFNFSARRTLLFSRRPAAGPLS